MQSENAPEKLMIFLTGMVVGAGVALLLAPQSGKKTRRDMRRKAGDARSYLEDRGEDLVGKGREVIDRGKQAAEDTVKELGKKVKARETSF